MPEQVGVAVQLYNQVAVRWNSNITHLKEHTGPSCHSGLLSAGVAQPLTLNPCSHNTVQAPGKWGSSQLLLWVCRIGDDQVRMLRRFLGSAAAGLRLLWVGWRTQGT